MRIFFLDQSGKLGGAELSLLDLAAAYKEDCLVGIFEDGPFRTRLQAAGISVEVLEARSLQVQKSSGIWEGIGGSLRSLIPLLRRVLSLSRDYDLIYTNTQKAFVVGAIASALTRKPLVHHQRDILSHEHFSTANLKLLIFLANRFANLIIANSQATKAAFVEAGGRGDRCQVVYNGFDPEQYQTDPEVVTQLRSELGLSPEQFVVGHFSRLSPWKGQHVLIEAIAQSPDNVVALLVGDALFGEDDYAQQLRQQVETLGLQDRVRFLGFRSDVPVLMALCNLVAHTSTAPEPFGRVIIEATLCGTPVVAAKAGGAVELIKLGQTGWLTSPGEAEPLADVIHTCLRNPAEARAIAVVAQTHSRHQFHLDVTRQQVDHLISALTEIESGSLQRQN